MRTAALNRKIFFVLLFLVSAFLLSIKLSAHAYALPAGFTKVQLAGSSSLTKPVTFRFANNGDVYIGEQAGVIKLFHSGSVLPTPVITLNAESNGEQGLLGMELDPNFATNGYLYVSYTTASGFSRLSRIKVVNGVASLSSEVVFAQGDQIANPHHNANDLHMGPDGKLWWSVGDNVPNQYNAQTLSNIYGKILRYNLDGSPPSDGPFVNVPGAVKNIYAYGVRNPFRFDFLPNGKAIVGETGQDLSEELDIIQKGANYGWPFVEGTCGSCGYADPAYDYQHIPNDGAISAISHYSGTVFPKAYNNTVFFGDYNRQDIELVTFNSTFTTETSNSVFDTGDGAIADLREGPDGNLYYMDIFGESFVKIMPTGPFAPTALASANKTSGSAPLKVQFSSSGSTDAYTSTLIYTWNFGDGTANSTAANPSHTYNTAGTYTATLTVKNNKGLTANATVKITAGHTAPTASITSPSSTLTYNAGATIAYSGTATDKVDGTLPASAYTWTVDFYQNGVLKPFYTLQVPHPFYGPVTGSTSGSFTIPQDISNTPNSFYRITLTATDTLGLSTTVTRDIHPNTTQFTVQSNSANIGFFVDGYWYTAPVTLTGVVGVQHGLMGLNLQNSGASRYRFHSWSDGGALLHIVTSPATSTTYTANYDSVSAVMPSPWQSSDVGSPALAGTAEYSSTDNSFYLDGNGYDIWGTYDQSHYVYQPLNGDGQIIARVTNLSNAQGEWAKAGVMIKDSTTSGSPYVNAFVTPGTSDVYPNNAPYDTSYFGVHMQANYNSDQAVSNPAGYKLPNEWLKLQRSGNLFSTYYSNDGVNWTLIGKTTVSMNTNATIGLFVTSHNIGALATASFDNVQVTAGGVSGQPLPSPWQNSDVGSPALAGSSSYDASSSTYTVNGSGSDIWGTTDQFQFAFQPLTGDGNIVARVTSQDNNDPWAKSGVMIKQSATAGAPYALIAVTPANGYHMQYDFNSDIAGGSYTFPNAWVKLQRTGNTFTSYTSVDGVNWTLIHSDTLSSVMSSSAVAGLFVSSHNSSQINTTKFDNVSVTPTGGALPAGWSSVDVGAPDPTGSSSFANNVYTVNGAGSDIWGTTDQFQYAYKSLSGDGTIIARVIGQDPTDPWAKSGVMIKQSTTAGSNYASLMTTPSNGVHLESNFNFDQTGAPTTSLPVWLKLTRTGATITAFQSADGITWTQVGNPITITMTDPVTFGLFVCSHNSAAINVTKFDNVSTTP